MAGEGIDSRAQHLNGTYDDNSKIQSFFGDQQDGPWMRWLITPSNKGILYFDNYNNLEFYGRNVSDIPPIFWQYAGKRTAEHVNTPMSENYWDRLEQKRMCVYSSLIHPTSDQLGRMAHTTPKECDAFMNEINANDIFDGVSVHEFRIPGGRFTVGDFLDYTPMSESQWMAWTDPEPGTMLYHDADGNIEIYTKRNAIQGLEPGPNNIYVKLNSDVDKFALRVARSRLYKKTNDLHATQEQLDDMIELIGRKPPYGDIKTWGDTLYKREAKADKTGWTFKPKAGSLPLKPQFYFNPKPLKKGDQSEYDKGTRIDHTSLLGLAMSSNWDKAW